MTEPDSDIYIETFPIIRKQIGRLSSLTQFGKIQEERQGYSQPLSSPFNNRIFVSCILDPLEIPDENLYGDRV
jgi:hypothetical protein